MHHNLIKSILKIHYITNEIVSVIENLYTDYGVSILTKNVITAPIPVERGVLQGDCLSPCPITVKPLISGHQRGTFVVSVN